MPTLSLDDGRTIVLRTISKRQLATKYNFSGSRERPVLIEVVAVDGQPISRTRLAVMDTHSLWLSHQAVVAPPSNGKPAATTGLSAAEAAASRSLFLTLVGDPAAILSPPPSGSESREDVSQGPAIPRPPEPSRLGQLTAWVREHVGRLVSAVVIAVLTAIVLAWLGLKQ